MKKIKSKVIALVLALTMLLSVGVTMVSAATTDEVALSEPTTTVTETNVATADEVKEAPPNYGFFIGIGAIAVGGLIAVGVMAIKSKRMEDDEE